jgi:hypothetical protein
MYFFRIALLKVSNIIVKMLKTIIQTMKRKIYEDVKYKRLLIFHMENYIKIRNLLN